MSRSAVGVEVSAQHTACMRGVRCRCCARYQSYRQPATGRDIIVVTLLDDHGIRIDDVSYLSIYLSSEDGSVGGGGGALLFVDAIGYTLYLSRTRAHLKWTGLVGGAGNVVTGVASTCHRYFNGREWMSYYSPSISSLCIMMHNALCIFIIKIKIPTLFSYREIHKLYQKKNCRQVYHVNTLSEQYTYTM